MSEKCVDCGRPIASPEKSCKSCEGKALKAKSIMGRAVEKEMLNKARSETNARDMKAFRLHGAEIRKKK